MFRTDEERVRSLGLRRGSVLQVLQAMQKSPYVSPSHLAEQTGLSFNTVLAALDVLKELRIVMEVKPRRGRLLCYSSYLELLDEGKEAI